MPDLDWSNVHDDATFAYEDFLARLSFQLDAQATANLERLRYQQRIEAHRTNYTADIDCLRMIDDLLLGRFVTTLCEGCLSRTGCDMCNPPQFDTADMYPSYDAETDHYERFGRPALPNEF